MGNADNLTPNSKGIIEYTLKKVLNLDELQIGLFGKWFSWEVFLAGLLDLKMFSELLQSLHAFEFPADELVEFLLLLGLGLLMRLMGSSSLDLLVFSIYIISIVIGLLGYNNYQRFKYYLYCLIINYKISLFSSMNSYSSFPISNSNYSEI